jgi:hypothetical protein
MKLLLFLLACLPVQAATVPVVHVTDLYHRPGDPDDQIDLAALYLLPELDVRAVLIDVRPPRTFPGQPYEPGLVTVAQLGYLTGKAAPVAIGQRTALRGPDDDARDRPLQEQAAIELLLRVLRESREPVVINAVGSCRIVTAAFHRDPALMRRKVRTVLLNAGSSGPSKLEHNVEIDVAAYVGLWRSGLGIDWYPCGSSTVDWRSPEAMGEHNTWWYATHSDLFRGVLEPLRRWYAFALLGSNRGDILHALSDLPAAEVERVTTTGGRNLWSIASLVVAAGRVLTKTAEGWRFVPAAQAGKERQILELDPVTVTVDDQGRTSWRAAAKSNVRLFRRTPGQEHTAAMTEALNALLRTFPASVPAF